MPYERHHLIPTELFDIEDSFLADLEAEGLINRDAASNLVNLPSDLNDAEATGQARHRGSHPAYSEFVQRVVNRLQERFDSDIDQFGREIAESRLVQQLELTQLQLKAGLNTPIGPNLGTPFRLNGQDLQNPVTGQGALYPEYNAITADNFLDNSRVFNDPEYAQFIRDNPQYFDYGYIDQNGDRVPYLNPDTGNPYTALERAHLGDPGFQKFLNDNPNIFDPSQSINNASDFINNRLGATYDRISGGIDLDALDRLNTAQISQAFANIGNLDSLDIDFSKIAKISGGIIGPLDIAIAGISLGLAALISEEAFDAELDHQLQEIGIGAAFSLALLAAGFFFPATAPVVAAIVLPLAALGLYEALNRIYDLAGQVDFITPLTEAFAGLIGRIDPLVIDLDGDGVNTTSVTASGVTFDLDNNGSEESVGWFEAEDGILVHDWKGNTDADGNPIGDGKAQDRSEVFATFDDLSRHDLNGDGILDASDVGPQATADTNGDGVIDATDVVLPADLTDTNGDGVIDINDVDARAQDLNGDGIITDDEIEHPIYTGDLDGDGEQETVRVGWDQVQVWIDANSNGNVDAGELNSFEDLGIVSIDLNETQLNVEDNGNLINSESTVTFGDGSTRTINGIDLFRDTINQSYEQQINTLDLSPERLTDRLDVFTLPQMLGSGNVPHLMIAALANDAVLEAWRAVGNDSGTSLLEFNGLVRELIYVWSGADELGFENRGAIQPRMLNAIEEFIGQEYVNPRDPAGTVRSNIANPADAVQIANQFNSFVDAVTLRFFVQNWTAIKASNPEVTDPLTYDFATDSFSGDWLGFISHLSARYHDENVSYAEQKTVGDIISHTLPILAEPTTDPDVAAAYQLAKDVFQFTDANRAIDFFDGFHVGYDDGTKGTNNFAFTTNIDGLDPDTELTSTVFTPPPGYYLATNDEGVFLTSAFSHGIENDPRGTDLHVNSGVLGGTPGQDNTYIADSLNGAAFNFETNVYIRNATVYGEGTLILQSLEDIRFHQSDGDLIISNARTGAAIFIEGQFRTSALGVETIELPESIRFGDLFKDDIFVSSVFEDLADKTTLTKADIARLALNRGTEGADYLVESGASPDQTFFGDKGRDLLFGGNGSDTYIYRRGDGNDVINEYGTFNGTDTLRLEDIAFNEVTLARSGIYLLIEDTVTGQVISVKGQFNSNSDFGLESIVFGRGLDGTPVSQDLGNGQIVDVIVPHTINKSEITSLAVYRGTDSDDVLTGTNGAETFYGSKNDDLLAGHTGDDTYIYYSGDGNDVIFDFPQGGTTGFDRLELRDLNRDDIELWRTQSDLTVYDKTTGQQIRISRQYDTPSLNPGIEELEFANGEILNKTQLRDLAIYKGTDGDDTLFGTTKDEVFDGGLGDDLIDGFTGADTYIYRLGDGNDTIRDFPFLPSDVNDTLHLVDMTFDQLFFLREGDDLIIINHQNDERLTVREQFNPGVTRKGIETILFSDGTTFDRTDIINNIVILGTDGADTIVGTSAADAIHGREGDDDITGGNGNDTIFGHEGNDTITSGNGDDTIHGHQGDDHMIGGDGNDIYIYTRGDGNDTIDESDHTYGNADQINLIGINPADVTVEVSGTALILVIAETSPGAGDGGQITLVGQNDAYYERGVETVSFDDGTVWTDNDVRNKQIINVQTDASGSFLYSKADGTVFINEAFIQNNGPNPAFKLTDVDFTDVTFAGYNYTAGDPANPDGIALRILWNDGVNSGELRIANMANSINEIEFADGTTIGGVELDVLPGGRDRIIGTDGDDVILGRAESELIHGGDGNDTIGVAGNSGYWQYLYGDEGDDTYLYDADSGDVLIDYHEGATSGTDVVKFTDLSLSDVTFTTHNYRTTTNGVALRVVVNDGVNSGQLRLAQRGQFIERYEFADGATLSAIEANVAGGGRDRYIGTSEDDVILGGSISEYIHGGDGNDTIGAGGNNGFWQYLYGEAGDDTYLYDADNGSVYINYTEGANSGYDTVRFTDLTLDQINLGYHNYNTSTDGNALRLMINNGVNSGELRIAQEGSYIERFEFSDSTVVEGFGTNGSGQITATFGNTTVLINGSSANDTLTGTTANEGLHCREWG